MNRFLEEGEGRRGQLVLGRDDGRDVGLREAVARPRHGHAAGIGRAAGLPVQVGRHVSIERGLKWAFLSSIYTNNEHSIEIFSNWCRFMSRDTISLLV
jgi:hypothetical protein